jgi:hypothetical protein
MSQRKRLGIVAGLSVILGSLFNSGNLNLDSSTTTRLSRVNYSYASEQSDNSGSSFPSVSSIPTLFRSEREDFSRLPDVEDADKQELPVIPPTLPDTFANLENQVLNSSVSSGSSHTQELINTTAESLTEINFPESNLVHYLFSGPFFRLPSFPLVKQNYNPIAGRFIENVTLIEYQRTPKTELITSMNDADELAGFVSKFYNPNTVTPDFFLHLAKRSGLTEEQALKLKSLSSNSQNLDLLAQFCVNYNVNSKLNGLDYYLFSDDFGNCVFIGKENVLTSLKSNGTRNISPFKRLTKPGHLKSILRFFSSGYVPSADYDDKSFNSLPIRSRRLLRQRPTVIYNDNLEQLLIDPLDSVTNIDDAERIAKTYSNVGRLGNVRLHMPGSNEKMQSRTINNSSNFNSYCDEVLELEHLFGIGQRTNQVSYFPSNPDSNFLESRSSKLQFSTNSGLVGIVNYIPEGYDGSFHILARRTTGVKYKGLFKENENYDVYVIFGTPKLNVLQENQDWLYVGGGVIKTGIGGAFFGVPGIAAGVGLFGIEGLISQIEGKVPPAAALYSKNNIRYSNLHSNEQRVYSLLQTAGDHKGVSDIVIVNYPVSSSINPRVNDRGIGVLFLHNPREISYGSNCVCFKSDSEGLSALHSLYGYGKIIGAAAIIGSLEQTKVIHEPGLEHGGYRTDSRPLGN